MGLVWPEKQKIKLKLSNVKKLCLTVGTDCIPVARQHKGRHVFPPLFLWGMSMLYYSSTMVITYDKPDE